jgi:hypothetical protein
LETLNGVDPSHIAFETKWSTHILFSGDRCDEAKEKVIVALANTWGSTKAL